MESRLTLLPYCRGVIDGLQMRKREIAPITLGRRSFLVCRQTDSEWTVSYDRWATGVRQITAVITLTDADGARVWLVVAMPGRRHRREVQTWAAALDTALNIR